MQHLRNLSNSTKTVQMKDFTIFTTRFNAYINFVEEIIIKYESRVKVLGQGV